MEEGAGSRAGDSLASGDQVGKSKEITVPMDLLPGCKAGDTYTVKSIEGDNVVLESSGNEESNESWGDGLVNAVKKGGENE